MFNKFLDIASIFDWISPLVAGVQDITNGPSHTFMIDEFCGWSGREIAHILRRHGVKTWGHMIVNRHIMITVRREQSRWAQYLLDREGIPIRYGVIPETDPHAYRQAKKRSRSVPAGKSPSWLDQLANIIDL